MTDKVTVAVRCRPPTTFERVRQEQSAELFDDKDKKTITTLKNKYMFNHVFTPESTQNEVFETIGRTVVEKVIEGYNGTILAYGQTGSGKSYSMGTEIMNASEGLAQRVVAKLFETSNISLAITSVEIYREEIYDLLSPKPVKLSVSQGLKAVNMMVETVDSLQQAKEVVMLAIKNRKIGATKENIKSSRSHMVITLSVTSDTHISKLNLVDLAGSERISENDLERNEGVAINSGLLHLLRVVHSLSRGASFVPYRDSKLTFLLKDSLSTKNYIALLACINSMQKNLEETEKTLDFASKFANIEVTPLMGSQIFGTPYKTPHRFQNKTFSSTSELFKKPLAPLNHTITTPISWAMKSREESQISCTPVQDLRRESSEILNMSNVSTSTALSDRGSPPPEVVDCMKDLLPTYTPMPMTSEINALIRATVEATVKATEKRMTLLFKRQLNELGRKENKDTWQQRLSEVGLDQSLDDSLSEEPSVLQTTVLGPNIELNTPRNDSAPRIQHEPVFKMPVLPVSLPRRSTRLSIVKKENLNGSFISDDSGTPDSRDGHSDSQPESGFEKPEPRRNMRLPMPNVYPPDGNSDLQPESRSEKPAPRRSMRLSVRNVYPPNGNSDSQPESTFEKPAPRQSMRGSVRKRAASYTDFDNTPDSKITRRESVAVSTSTARRSLRLSSVGNNDKKNVEKGARERLPSKTDHLSHEERILEILRTGDSKELVKLPTVGLKTAALILNHRRLNGPMKSVKDFVEIRGLTKNQCQKFLWANSLI